MPIRYVIFVVSVILLLGAIQVVVQYDLNLQNSDAKLINLAGRQRMLSQRISKLALFLNYNATHNINSSVYSIDSLRKLTDQWQSMHYYLVRSNQEERKSKAIDSLFRINTPYLDFMVKAIQRIIVSPEHEVIQHAIDDIATVELPFLLTMDRIVFTYQREAEEKLRTLKQLEIILSVIALIVLLSEFFYIVLPVFREMQAKNKRLVEMNAELAASEEEVRSNLEVISSLQTDLEIRQKQYAGLVDEATDMIYELDAEGKFSFVNPVLEQQSGYSREELIGKPYWELMLPEDRESVVGTYVQQREREQKISYLEFRMHSRLRSAIWIGQNVKMFFNAKRVEKVSVVARDITKIKNMEFALLREQEELARKEKLYRLLSENSQDVISISNLDGTFEFVSPSCIGLHGYTPAELIGKKGTDFIQFEDAKRITERTDEISRKMKNGETIEPMQFRLMSKHGGPIWVENVVKPIFTNGELTGFQSTVRDISARKAYEEELVEARKKAENATLAKSQFLSMMSHEIRTPLNGIIGLTHHLLDERPRTDQQENLNLLKFSGENLLTIINDILDFGKIEANKIVLEKTDFNLQQELSNIVKLMQMRTANKVVKVYLEYDPKLPLFIKADAVRVGRIVNNLMSNAVKFTEAGFVRLKATLVQKGGSSVTIAFEVEDSGIGIPANKLGTIFESFSQASDDTTRRFGGTGLGLTITRQLLRLMDSDISVESVLGKGSRFYFTLTADVGEPPQTKRASNGHDKDFLSTGMRVLLVEDDLVNQVVARNFLTKWGLEVVIAGDGLQALEKIKERSYHLVFMDINMPELDGYETVREIRKMSDPYFKEVPIIALTADAVGDVREKVMEAGMNGIMNKPFEPAELKQIITRHAPGQSVAEDALESVLDQYTNGDSRFREEFVNVLIKNITELQVGFEKALDENDSMVFREVVHKCSTALKMIGEKELIGAVQKVKLNFETNKHAGKILPADIEDFSNHTRRVIEKLKKVLQDRIQNPGVQNPES